MFCDHLRRQWLPWLLHAVCIVCLHCIMSSFKDTFSCFKYVHNSCCISTPSHSNNCCTYAKLVLHVHVLFLSTNPLSLHTHDRMPHNTELHLGMVTKHIHDSMTGSLVNLLVRHTLFPLSLSHTHSCISCQRCRGKCGPCKDPEN